MLHFSSEALVLSHEVVFQLIAQGLQPVHIFLTPKFLLVPLNLTELLMLKFSNVVSSQIEVGVKVHYLLANLPVDLVYFAV